MTVIGRVTIVMMQNSVSSKIVKFNVPKLQITFAKSVHTKMQKIYIYSKLVHGFDPGPE